MKRMILILCVLSISTLCNAGMSMSNVRKETRFLTDKMAHELKLNSEQYNDAYEINFDFIYNIRDLMDNVMGGQEWALDRYYDCLDTRNDDLRWVLSNRQYNSFIKTDYFFRPVYVNGGRWQFRIYITYSNISHFFFPRPYHYRTYCGGHYRNHYPNGSYYRGRHNHPTYSGIYRIRDNKSYHTSRRSDFGSVSIRPNTSRRPESNKPSDVRREPSNTTTSRRESDNNSSRRSKNANSERKENVSSRRESKENSRRSSSSSPASEGNRSSRSSRSSDNRR